MKKQTAVMFFASVLAACVGDTPSTGGGGNGDGTGGGNGDGTGGGGGGGGGGGNGSGGGGGNGSTSAQSFLGGMAQKYCDEAFMCKANFPTDAGVTFEQAFGASVQACVSDAAAYDAQVDAQIAAGTIKFNAADAAACLAGITFPACTTFWTNGPMYPAACATALVGTVADGGACVVDYECSSQMSYCDETTKKCTADTGQARFIPQI